MYPDEVSPEGWMRENGGWGERRRREGEMEEKRRERRGGGKDRRDLRVACQWITKPFASLVFTPSFIPTSSKLRLEDAARCRSKPAYPLSSS